MRATGGILAAFVLGALAVPISVEEKSPYLMPAPVLESDQLTILKPITGSGDASPRRPPVDGYRNLKLKKDITLAWKSDDALTQAVLKADYNAAPEFKVINMEDFGDLLEDVDCTAPHMFIDFKRAEDISNAIREWGWVNEKTKNKLVVFANHPKCGDDATREPYLVTAIKYNKKDFRADMEVEPVEDFESVIPEGVLEIDTLIDPNDVLPSSFFEEAGSSQDTSPASPLITTHKRADATISLSLNRDMSRNIFRIDKKDGGGYVSLDCTDCGTRGYLRAKAYVHISWFKVKKAYVEFRSQDVEVRVNLQLEAHIEHHVTGHVVLVPLMVYIGIPKIIALRFGANLGVGWDVGFEATGRVGWGITGKLQDSLYRNCLKGCSDVNQGWEMTWIKKQPSASGEIAVTTDVHAFINPNFGVDLFGFGYEGGVAFLAPQFTGEVALEANTNGGVCGNPATTIGLDVELAYGYSAYAYVGRDYQDTDWQADLFSPRRFVFYDQCFAIKNK